MAARNPAALERIRQRRAEFAKAVEVDVPPDADRVTRLASVRRDFEQAGGRWDAPATVGTVQTIMHMLVDAIGEEREERKQLEKRVGGIQTKSDHLERHALSFAGEWQAALSYHEGQLVASKGALFVAAKSVGAGRDEPTGRAGSGWVMVVPR